MFDAKVTVDAQAVRDAFARVTDSRLPTTIAQEVARQVVLPKLAQYPSPSGAKQPFVSDKSRRYFFAALRSGQIAVPYRRTGALGAIDNWTQTPESDGLTLTSTAKHSDLVRGASTQAKYFQGNWLTDDQIAQASEDQAALVATAVLVEAIGDAGP